MENRSNVKLGSTRSGVLPVLCNADFLFGSGCECIRPISSDDLFLVAKLHFEVETTGSEEKKQFDYRKADAALQITEEKKQYLSDVRFGARKSTTEY